MSKVFDFSGGDAFFPGGFLYPNPKRSHLFLSAGDHVDVYFPSSKRSRVVAPFVVSEEQKPQPSIDVLPDQCLYEVLRRLHGGQERTACAGVSKRWLMLLSTIRRDEIFAKNTPQSLESEKRSNLTKVDEIETEAADEDLDSNADGCLSRCLEGKKATDVRLASIAVGTASRGGLGKLSVRGTSDTHGLTNFGLKAIACCCPSLKVLSLWNLSSVGDEGLLQIADECHMIEKLDLSHCTKITDKGLIAIANNCPNLMSVTIESCPNIGNASLRALGSSCANLRSITIKSCPLITDQGTAALFSSAGRVLTKAKLEALSITDVSLAVIGHYGHAITDLALLALQNVNERGFWVMSNGQGLQKLRSFMVTACRGVSDLGLESMGKGCPNLKQIYLRKCPLVSDNGLMSFAKASSSLESLLLDECHRITQSGVVGILGNSGGKLKALTLRNCLGIQDVRFGFPLTSLCNSLVSLTISNCPGFGDASLAMVGKLCPNLTNVCLSGLQGITDAGLLPLVHNTKAGLEKLNLSGCVNLTDNVVSTAAMLHGTTLELLNLDGCKCVTDESLVAIARDCCVLRELDISKCGITDAGIAALAGAQQLSLQILSLAGCALVSDKSSHSLALLGRFLVGLNIQRCNGMSCGTVDMLLEQIWRCDILY